MKSKIIHILIVILLILVQGSQPSYANDFFLPERINFHPGVIYKIEDLTAKMYKGHRVDILNAKHPTFDIQVPYTQRDTTYALICRSRSIKQDSFNMIKVSVNGTYVGNYYPCTEIYTNKKLLFKGIEGSFLDIKLELIEGPGCLLHSFRIYSAETAYRIKRLSGHKTNFTIGYLSHFKADRIFKKRAIESERWIEDRVADKKLRKTMGGIRLLVKRTANWARDPETFKMMIGRFIEYLETPSIRKRHNISQDISYISFSLYYLLKRWGKIENDNRYRFSNAWRLEIVNTLYYMARLSFMDWCAYRLNRHYRKYRYIIPDEWRNLKIGGYAFQFQKEQEVLHVIPACREFDARHPIVPNNHMTHPALSLFYAAKYFERYGISETGVWLDVSRWTFAPLMHSSKPMEDCYSYQLGAMILAAKYALADGKMDFFRKGGPLWNFLDLQIMSTNNKGDGVSYGDVMRYGKGWFNRYIDGKDVFGSLISNTPIPMPERLRRDLQERKKEDFCGLHIHKLDDSFYSMYAKGLSKKLNPIPKARCFDKISFRQGWSRDDQYLLLDGVSVGYHGHQDVNAILEFSAKNRIWLIDMGYWQKGIRKAKWHNMITISRPGVKNGEESPVQRTPPFCSLIHKADLSEVAFLSTGLSQYNGTNWVRNIIWKKGQYFVVFDEINNFEKTNCTVTNRWHTLGEIEFSDKHLSVTQKLRESFKVKDRRKFIFRIIQLDNSVSKVVNAVDVDKDFSWKDYPYAKPVIRILEQTMKFDENSSSKHVFMNVLYVNYVNKEQNKGQIKATRINDSSIRVLGDEFNEVIGINGIETDEIKTDASLFIIGKQKTFLCNATYFDSNGIRLFNNKNGKSVELDFLKSTHIGNNVRIGVGSPKWSALCIGGNARIGANRVVVKDVSENTTAVVAPAKITLK